MSLENDPVATVGSNESARAGRRILVLYYSQSGDVKRVVKWMMNPLERAGVELVWESVSPRMDYPWPWRSLRRFFDVMPETVLGPAPELRPVSFDPDQRYDLVVLAYQVWYLSPSLPIQAFLNSPYARVLRGTGVITVSVSRNMWQGASESMKQKLAALGAVHMDNVVVTHQGPPWATFISTPRWLLVGKRDRLWGWVPPGGIGDGERPRMERFGTAVADQLDALGDSGLPSLLRGLGAVTIQSRYILPEWLAAHVFRVSAHGIQALGRYGAIPRAIGVYLFMGILVTCIVVALPAILIGGALLRPLLRKRIAAYADRLARPSGESDEEAAADADQGRQD